MSYQYLDVDVLNEFLAHLNVDHAARASLYWALKASKEFFDDFHIEPLAPDHVEPLVASVNAKARITAHTVKTDRILRLLSLFTNYFSQKSVRRVPQKVYRLASVNKGTYL